MISSKEPAYSRTLTDEIDPASFENLSLKTMDSKGPVEQYASPGPSDPIVDATFHDDDDPMSSSDDEFFNFNSGGDGPGDRLWARKRRDPVASVFIHAGAGYHSVTNEKFHLEVCSDAARMAIKFLRTGASAVDAVEAAIKCLEDKEITNAGYGSNLSMDGVVECDATIVDHLGRSGACGAVPNIKNPISLARMILDTSSRPLSLRRVPPNILVGKGAADFAYAHGMPLLPNEFLISKNAKDRYLRWSEDLKRADNKVTPTSSPGLKAIEDKLASAPAGYEKELSQISSGDRRDHLTAILTGTFNEGQPDSPQHVPTPIESGSPRIQPSQLRSPAASPVVSPAGSGTRTPGRSPLAFMGPGQAQARSDSPASKKARFNPPQGSRPTRLSTTPESTEARDGYFGVAPSHDSSMAMDADNEEDSYGFTTGPQLSSFDFPGAHALPSMSDEDKITDTVGAIAIDLKGNIAAASSSGGIGMKHSGRIGPAALVGIGSAVIPVDPLDNDMTSVAVVTSGTGEHMATTMASQKCAERLYYNHKRGPGGSLIPEYNEDALMESFITDDFMNHPGVKNQSSTGAIGVMAVKKLRSGHYFFFAHNTDSFALASMSSNEKEPLMVMSRLGENRTIARGGRKIKAD